MGFIRIGYVIMRVKILIAFIITISLVVFYSINYLGLRSNSVCQVPKAINSGPGFVDVHPYYRDIETFAVYIDYGGWRGHGQEEFKILNCINDGVSSIKNCPDVHLNYVNKKNWDVYFENVKLKYVAPFNNEGSIKALVNEGISKAYSDCLDGVDVVFVDHISNPILKDKGTLGIHIKFPLVLHTAKYSPHIAISLYRDIYTSIDYYNQFAASEYYYDFYFNDKGFRREAFLNRFINQIKR